MFDGNNTVAVYVASEIFSAEHHEQALQVFRHGRVQSPSSTFL